MSVTFSSNLNYSHPECNPLTGLSGSYAIKKEVDAQGNVTQEIITKTKLGLYSSKYSLLRGALKNAAHRRAQGGLSAAVGLVTGPVTALFTAAIDSLMHTFKVVSKTVESGYRLVKAPSRRLCAELSGEVFAETLRAFGSAVAVPLAPVGAFVAPSKTLTLATRVKLTPPKKKFISSPVKPVPTPIVTDLPVQVAPLKQTAAPGFIQKWVRPISTFVSPYCTERNLATASSLSGLATSAFQWGLNNISGPLALGAGGSIASVGVGSALVSSGVRDYLKTRSTSSDKPEEAKQVKMKAVAKIVAGTVCTAVGVGLGYYAFFKSFSRAPLPDLPKDAIVIGQHGVTTKRHPDDTSLQFNDENLETPEAYPELGGSTKRFRAVCVKDGPITADALKRPIDLNEYMKRKEDGEHCALLTSSPTEETFEKLCQKIDCAKLQVFDLRQEGHFTASYKELDDNGMPAGPLYQGTFTIQNEGKDDTVGYNASQLDSLERLPVDFIQAKQPVTNVCFKNDDKDEGALWYTCPRKVQYLNAKTEKQLVEDAGGTYHRVPMVDHKVAPPEALHKLADLYRKVPKEHHILLHCSAGQGRTRQAGLTYLMTKGHAYAEASVIYDAAHGKNTFCKPKKTCKEWPVENQLIALSHWMNKSDVKAALADPNKTLPELALNLDKSITCNKDATEAELKEQQQGFAQRYYEAQQAVLDRLSTTFAELLNAMSFHKNRCKFGAD